MPATTHGVMEGEPNQNPGMAFKQYTQNPSESVVPGPNQFSILVGTVTLEDGIFLDATAPGSIIVIL